MESAIHLESAVKDIQLAVKLAPEDTALQRLLSNWRREMARQNAKDRKTFGNMFNKGELYKDDDTAQETHSGPFTTSCRIHSCADG
jgi:hypothetical protein